MWVRRLSNIDTEAMTAVCASCGPVAIRRKYRKTKAGKEQYKCSVAHREANKRCAVRPAYRRHLKDRCERCGFGGDSCQRDIHHKDKNHKNNDPSNFETLCANCHRLEQ